MQLATLLTNLAQGQSFTFTPGGAVFTRCRGGYRPGLGGPLVKINPDQRVYRYSTSGE